MSTTETSRPATWDTGGASDQGVPMGRLIRVELRKMYDTRAGRWLLVAIAGITLLVMVIFMLNAPTSERRFSNFVGITGAPQGFLLPVLGILLVTQEWGQRTGMVTFTLVPHRGKVIWAKIVAALLLGLAAVVLALALASVFTLVFGNDDAWSGVTTWTFVNFLVLQALGVVQGLAFGLILLNSAFAIVLFFILPTLFTIVASLWGWLRDRAEWLDFATAQQPLFDGGGSLSGAEWAHLASASAIWVILPFVAGLVRVFRAEIK